MRRLFFPLLLIIGGVLRADPAGPDIPGVSVVVSHVGAAGYELTLRNDSDAAVSYSGYGGENSTQPVYSAEVWRKNKWIPVSIGWCGVGMGPCKLKPKKEVKVSLGSYIFQDVNPGEKVRVIVAFASNPKLRSGALQWIRIFSNDIVISK